MVESLFKSGTLVSWKRKSLFSVKNELLALESEALFLRNAVFRNDARSGLSFPNPNEFERKADIISREKNEQPVLPVVLMFECYGSARWTMCCWSTS